MAFQIIFVVETDEQSRSDYMYIRAVLDKYYNALTRKDIKFTPIFTGEKGNYNKSKVVKAINNSIKGYSVNGDSHVIY